MNTLQLLDEIEKNFVKIKKRNERLEKENEDLKDSVFEYLQKLETAKKEIAQLETSLKATHLAHAGNTDVKMLRKELDKYIYMIDKCIAAVQTDLS